MFQELQSASCNSKTDPNNDGTVVVAQENQRKMSGF